MFHYYATKDYRNTHTSTIKIEVWKIIVTELY